jgi:hypothetical protein
MRLRKVGESPSQGHPDAETLWQVIRTERQCRELDRMIEAA